MKDFLTSQEPKGASYALYSRIKEYEHRAFNPLRHTPIALPEPLPANLKSPFLLLSIEIRQLIYSYLIPNTIISVYPPRKSSGRKVSPPLRYDRESCCLALLGTNRQIYHEMIGPFYSSATYCLKLEDSHLRFLNFDQCYLSDLPFSFRFLRSLSFTIHLKSDWLNQMWRVDTLRDRKARKHIEMLDAVAEFFSLEGPGRLRDLEVWVSFLPSDFSRFKCDERFCICEPMKRLPSGKEWAVGRRAATRHCLEVNLSSLKKIRILGSVSVRHLNLPCVSSNWGEYREILITVGKEYFGSLEKEISGALVKQ
jgi:hypothetical protein